MSSIVDEVAAQQLHDVADDVRFIIAHPRYVQQYRILGHLLWHDDVLYLRFEGSRLNYNQLYEQLQIMTPNRVDAPALENVRYLILDECDRAFPPDLTVFLSEIVGQVGGGRIIILARTVPDFVFTNPELREQSCFIPTDTALMFTDYSHLDNGQILLEVEALGSGRVSLNGRPIDNWDGTLPRALFFYLVDRGMSCRNEIFETFWPSLSVREATNVFHVTKRKISEVLGFDLTKYWSGFYHISPDIQLRYDVEIFSQHVMDSAVASDERALDLLSSAIALYKNDFLTSIPMSWSEKRREQLFSTYGDGLALLARVMEGYTNNEEALGLYLRASVTNPQREDIARNIMRLYAEKHMYNDAEAIYKQLVSALETNLVGVSPSKETQELIGRIRSETTILK